MKTFGPSHNWAQMLGGLHARVIESYKIQIDISFQIPVTHKALQFNQPKKQFSRPFKHVNWVDLGWFLTHLT